MDRLHTPPSEDEEHQRKKKRQRRSSSIFTEDLPLTPHSIVATDLSDEEEIELNNKEDWEIEEDEVLLTHVLGLPLNNFKWKKLEAQFGDRHMAKMCSERWVFLKKQLVKDIRTVVKEKEFKL